MKMPKLSYRVRLEGEEKFHNGDRVIDFYLVSSNGARRIYAFTRKYSNNSWNLVKSGAPVNKIITNHSGDPGVKAVVNQTRRMIPYLVEEYGIV